MKKSLFLALSLCLCSSGCATILSGSSQRLTVNSTPEGAKIYLDSEFKGETPATFTIKRRLESRQLKLVRQGHPDYYAPLEANFNAVSLINLLAPVGFLVDAVSGALVKYDPAVHFILEDPTVQPKASLASKRR